MEKNSSNWVSYLAEYVGKMIMILLRDGRTVHGYLKTMDNYVNLVLNQTKERIYVENKYSDIEIGTIIVRGENVIICGLVDCPLEKQCLFEKVPIDQLFNSEKPETMNLCKLKIARRRAKEGFSVSGFSEYLNGF